MGVAGEASQGGIRSVRPFKEEAAMIVSLVNQKARVSSLHQSRGTVISRSWADSSSTLPHLEGSEEFH